MGFLTLTIRDGEEAHVYDDAGRVIVIKVEPRTSGRSRLKIDAPREFNIVGPSRVNQMRKDARAFHEVLDERDK